jgi:tetratricopeptide (TPR) repeat protein
MVNFEIENVFIVYYYHKLFIEPLMKELINYDEAIKAFNQAVYLDPKLAKAYDRIGIYI